MKIAPDGSTSTTQLSSSNSDNSFPGTIIPDGQGGVLTTWTIMRPDRSAPPRPHPYQAADVSPGGGVVTRLERLLGSASTGVNTPETMLPKLAGRDFSATHQHCQPF
jgi:hypothetical protein